MATEGVEVWAGGVKGTAEASSVGRGQHEFKLSLRRGSSWGDRRRVSRPSDALEVVTYRDLIGERGDEAHAAPQAGQRVPSKSKTRASKQAQVRRWARACGESRSAGALGK